MPRLSPSNRYRSHCPCWALFLTMAWAAIGPGAAAAPGSRPAAAPPSRGGSPSTATATATSRRADARLPATIRPLRYELDLTIIPGREEYGGTVTIPLQIEVPTRVVWLQASDLRIVGAEIRVPRDRRSLPVRVMQGSEDRIGFATETVLAPGRATLAVRFAGRMDSARSRGIYRQSEGYGGEGRDWYTYTSFEPKGARRAFPCFDEPAFKAPWHLALHVRKDDMALANAPLESEENEPDGMKVVRFTETPPLPSDLVAFAVGPFAVVPGAAAVRPDLPFRLVVPRGYAQTEAAYALSVTPLLVTLLEGGIDVLYPYGKLDVVVTPRTPGAAGHPGLVVIGSSSAFTKPGEQMLQRRQDYANAAARALARGWFGGLVTLRSRGEAWLDESLARWLALKALDRLEPRWRISLGALGLAHRGVMTFDSVAAAEPLRHADSEEGFDLVFNAESRPAKGGAILDMLEAWVGAEKFRRFLHDYLTVHAYAGVTIEDFLKLLGEQAGAETAAAMGSFIDQPGVPLLSFEMRCAPSSGSTGSKGDEAALGQPPRLLVSQERLLPVGLQGSNPQTWRIPMCVKYGAYGEVRRVCTVLGERQAEVPLEPLDPSRPDGCPAWVMPQENGHGYYRVRYTPAVLQQLGAARAQLTLPERVVILEDMEAGVAKGDLKQGEALPYVPGFLGADADFQVLDSTLELVQVRPELLPPELVPRWAHFLQDAYGPRARSLGWRPRPDESEVETQARPKFLLQAALAGDDPQLQAEATKLVKRWLDAPRTLQGELVPVALVVAARQGDRMLQERYWAAAKAASEALSKAAAKAASEALSKATPTTPKSVSASVPAAVPVSDRPERGPILTAVGGFDEPALVRDALARILVKGFESGDASHILAGVSDNWRTRQVAYDFIKQHFDVLAERMRPDDLLVAFELPGRFCDEAHRNEAASFFMPRAARIEGAARVLAQSLESLDRCIAYQKQHLPSVIEFLKKR